MFTWKAHAKPIYQIRFSPCGQYLLTSSNDETVRLWNREGRQLRQWPGSRYAAPLDYSTDGRFIAHGGYDVRVWSSKEDATEPIIAAEGYRDSVAFSPDCQVFVAHGNSDRPLARWSLPDGKSLPGGWGGVRTAKSFPTGPLAYSPDGKILATLFGVYSDNRFESVVVLWNPKTGKEAGRLEPQPSVSIHATQLSFSPDGTLLAGIYGADLIVWNVKQQIAVARRQPTKKHFKGVVFSQDGRKLFTSSNDKSIRVWSAPSWDESTGYEWKVGKLGGIAVSLDGTLAAAGSESGKVVVWDLDT